MIAMQDGPGRREVLAGLLLAAAAQGRAMAQTDLQAVAREAWLYMIPLIEFAGVRARAAAGGLPINRFNHSRTLADHTSRGVTTPNNDTLYSSAHVDLSRGPVTFTLPAAGERYFSLALMDAYTNNFAVLGTRTTGGGGGVVRLFGPNAAAEGSDVLRSPTNHVWALARTLVTSPPDLPAAHAVQDRLTITGPAFPAPGPVAGRAAPWPEFFAAASRLMVANPPPLTDRAELARIAPLQLGAGFDPARFNAADAARIAAGVAEARTRAGGPAAGPEIGGWAYPRANLGDFGEDYAYRAAIAISGLAALPAAEAMYMRSQGELPRGLHDGRKRHVLRFLAGRAPPVNSFWSLSLYEATPEGQFFFADNSIHRYAIGDRTPGLKTNADGSLDIYISHDAPPADRQANWLPAPAGPFALNMRTYLPKPELLDGRYRLPPVLAA
jgi:hypothetical protein